MKRVFLAVVMSVGSAFAATVPSPRNRQTLAAFRNAVRASLIAVLAAGLVPVGVSAALVYAPPEAINHVYWTSLNTSLAVAAPGLLSRHTGGHGLSTTVTATSTPGQGTLTPVVDPLGSFTYTPNTGFRGTDTFTYTITDPTSAAPQSSTATVTITVGTLVGLTFITAPDFFSLLGATPCNATVSSTFRFRASGTLTPPNGGNPGGPTFDETGTFTLDSANGPLSAFQATFTIRGTGQPDIVGTMALAALGSGGCTQTPFGLLSSVHFVVETSYSATGPLVETGFASTTIDAAGLDHGDTGNFWQGPFTLVAVAPGNTGIGAPVVSLDNVTVTFANVTVAGDTTLRRSVFGPQAPAGFAIAGGAIYYTVSTNAVFTGTAVVCITDYADIGYGRPNAALLHYNNPPPPIVGVDVTDYAKYPGGPTICSIPLTSLSPFVIAVPVTVAATQVITFGPLANKTFGDAPFSVSATASSGLTVSFTASGACTVTGSLVTITGAGACTITASQAGNANFNAATPVSQTFTVAVAVARPPFIIPAGSTASFTNVQFGACNSLSWGYQLDGGSNQVQATFPGGCGTGTAQDVTIGPFATDITLRVFLTDNVCAFTYYSDGTPVDHVIVEGSNPYSLRFADAGGFCERKTTTFNDFAGFNFRVDLAIRQVTKLTVNNSTGDFNDSATLSGTLQNSSGNPIVGATVTFTVSGQSCSGVTDATGSGSCAITPNEAAGSYTITGSYAGSASFLPASGTGTLVVTLEETTIKYTGPTNIPSGSPTTLSAVLLEDGATPIAGRTVTLTLGSGATAQSCTGVTNAAGVASCTIASVNQPGGPGTATASFAGDAFYRPATDTKPILNFSFLATGSFVIGDQNAVVGNSVTFWGAQWAKDNSLSGGSAPHSFKGFAENPTPPSCGTGWSADPGNSTPPPDGPLPAYMAVIVTSSADKSGSTISGNTVHIVVVQTNPGYASNPGHAGTGTVVVVVC